MDMTTVELINVVGFPITVSIALFWYNREMMKENRLSETSFRETLKQNTEIMRELVNLIKEQRK